jgi:hypothetical protein
MNSLKVLQQAILDSHRSTAHHLSSVPLSLVLVDDRVWDGVVEIFMLTNHPEAKTAYAWTDASVATEDPKRHVVVLHLPPVDSPQTAVRHAMAN